MLPPEGIGRAKYNLGFRFCHRLSSGCLGEDTIIVHDDHIEFVFKALEPWSDAREGLRMNKTVFHGALLSALLLAGASNASAQSGIPLRGPDYFRDASELAATLGSAHAIRVRCNGREDQYWRRYMADLLRYEAPEKGNLRSSLVQGFNNAYTRTSAQYLSCDNRAIEAEARFARDGQDIAGRMATHYFPKDTRKRGPN